MLFQSNVDTSPIQSERTGRLTASSTVRALTEATVSTPLGLVKGSSHTLLLCEPLVKLKCVFPLLNVHLQQVTGTGNRVPFVMA